MRKQPSKALLQLNVIWLSVIEKGTALKNPTQAAKWYKEAAKQGNAMLNVIWLSVIIQDAVWIKTKKKR